MNLTLARQMIAADILKLRRHRPTMLAAALLSIGITLLYLVVTVGRHDGHLPGDQTLANGAALMGLYFGSFAAILVGTEAGTIDLAHGVFRDLAATGRSRTALFLTRIPAAVIVALAFTVTGFVTTIAAAVAYHGPEPAPSLHLAFDSLCWVVLTTAVVTTVSVSAGAAFGSRSISLITVIGWQTIATSILYVSAFLGSARFLVLLVSLCRFLPGSAVGSREHPGSTNTLVNYKLDMPASVAILVIIGWVIGPVVIAAARTNTRDA